MNSKEERDLCKGELLTEINDSKIRVKKILDQSNDVPFLTKSLHDDLMKITQKFIFFNLADCDEDCNERNILQKVQKSTA